jgi:radical SAM protein with 4Fe4S-binding SPASM domain
LHKNKETFYDMDAIIDGLDNVLSKCDKAGVVLSFYPEPWININRTNELVSRSLELLTKYPRFISHFMIMMGTNGVNLHKPIPILEHVRERLSLNVTLDGIKEMHDMYRVFPDGSPSWEIVKNNIKTYQNKYSIYSTKVTIGPEALKYMYDSVIFLWDEMNMVDVNMNIVFEDVWTDEMASLELFENQLQKLYNEIIKNERWKTQYVGLLGSRNIPLSQIVDDRKDENNRIYCGATQMRSIDTDGKIYPCFRLSPYSLKEDKKFNINGSEFERSLKVVNNFDTSPSKCRHCPLITSCSMCVGGAYEEKASLFWRTTNHCNFQKLQYKYSLMLYNAINPDKPIKMLETT